MLTSEIQISKYHLFRWDRNRNGGGVACYIRNDLNYDVRSRLPEVIIELLSSITKTVAVGTIYCAPNQTNFMDIFNKNLFKVDTNNVGMYIRGDFNINLWWNNHYIFQKYNFLLCQSVTNDVKDCFDFCMMFSLKQFLESPIRIIYIISSIIDQILASFSDGVVTQ